MPIFCVKSVKIYTGQKKFTRTPSVASVTNIRYALFKVSDYVAEFWNTVSNLSMIGGPKIIIIKIILIIIMALLTSSAQCLRVMVYGA